jgi:hypothetical protein
LRFLILRRALWLCRCLFYDCQIYHPFFYTFTYSAINYAWFLPFLKVLLNLIHVVNM